MPPTEIGRRAESVAATWLAQRGFTILDRNWRTRWCELDIVAAHREVIHIVEVKYRRRPDFGSGLEYITPRKAARLQRAALMWLKAHGGPDRVYQIDAIAITGAMTARNVVYLPHAVTDA